MSKAKWGLVILGLILVSRIGTGLFFFVVTSVYFPYPKAPKPTDLKDIVIDTDVIKYEFNDNENEIVYIKWGGQNDQAIKVYNLESKQVRQVVTLNSKSQYGFNLALYPTGEILVVSSTFGSGNLKGYFVKANYEIIEFEILPVDSYGNDICYSGSPTTYQYDTLSRVSIFEDDDGFVGYLGLLNKCNLDSFSVIEPIENSAVCNYSEYLSGGKDFNSYLCEYDGVTVEQVEYGVCLDACQSTYYLTTPLGFIESSVVYPSVSNRFQLNQRIFALYPNSGELVEFVKK